MKPFAGIRIVDFTQAHAGSLATMLLADMGAEVIKIERAGSGDLARYWAPFRDGNSGYYAFLNRGKKSMSLNLTTPEGKEIVHRLLATADVVCENFKYGSMERMGLTYEVMREIKPDIIYASLNGFGQTGPMKKTIGLDLQLQAMSGIMDATGAADGDPVRVGVAFGDHLSGTYMALAISLALMERKRTGQGQRIDIAILDVLFSLHRQRLAGALPACRLGNRSPEYAPCDGFRTKDGWLLIQVVRDEQWEALCGVLGLNELAARADLKTNQERLSRYESELKAPIAAAAAKWERDALAQALTAAGVPCSPVHTVAEAMDSPRSAGLLAEVQDSALGAVRFPDSHFHIDTIDTKVTCSAPLQGEHTVAYLRELGYSDLEIAALREKGAAEGGEDA